MDSQTLSSRIAEELLRIGAVKIRPHEPFRWSSGWLSPIYCDNRLTLSYPSLRSEIKEGLVKLIREHFAQAEGIAGVATAGIPQGALVADALNLPFCYVRSKPKEHGMGNQIEGRFDEGQAIVVVEDLISTGGSSLQAVEALRAAGAQVLGVVAVVTYGFEHAREAFEQAKVPYYTLTDYRHIIEAYGRHQGMDEATRELLNRWRLTPDRWQP
ncbi:orotate phosphoribosyltransferase [Thermonema rossianum]|uniref:orotate phosphoribosyltransferase n=1 Tax=Thermonema rossianum TaxID=55505 RepID=UPI00056DF41C|nr:orotate phosphoribosyltransferase [Thermonema rossianum]